MAILLLWFCVLVDAQRNFVLIDVHTQTRVVKSDSLTATRYLDSLAQNHYFLTRLVRVLNTEQDTEIYFDKGTNYNRVEVNLSEDVAKILRLQKTFVTKDLDSLKRVVNQTFVSQGYVFNRLKTKYLRFEKGMPVVDISVLKGRQHHIDRIVLRNYNKVPIRFLKHLEGKYRNRLYNSKHLLGLQNELRNHPFVFLKQSPQTQFSKDSTHVFLFLEKKNTNTFDGIIGFGNNDNRRLSFNGKLQLDLKNMFNAFEQIALFWQRSPNKAQTFDLKTEFPYLFQSSIGTRMHVNIYRQDSAFAVVKFNPGFFYNIRDNQKLGIRATLEVSSVTDALYPHANDYSKKGVGVWYEYMDFSSVALFPYKTRFRFSSDFLDANYPATGRVFQKYYQFFGEHHLNVNNNHWLNLKAESGWLSSKKDFTTNELLRFGGWNSMRGFGENALFADFYYYGNAEYRYLIGGQAYVDVFMQYGQLNNKALGLAPKLYSFGVGFSFFVPLGQMSFQISNGNFFGNPLRFADTKIHWGILAKF